MNRTARTNEPRLEHLTLVLVPRSIDQGWRCLLIQRERSGLSIVADRMARAGDPDLPGWLAGRNPAKALVLLPALATIARTCTLPPAEGPQLASALRLQAETALLGGMAKHRVAMAVLPAAGPGVRARQGVILAWPESSAIPELPQMPEGIDVRFVPSMAALLALSEGLPPPTPIVRCDAADGAIQVVAAGREGVSLRSTREDPSDAAAFRDGARRALVETMLAEGRSSEELDATVAGIDAVLEGSDGVLPGAAQGRLLMVPPTVAASLSATLPAIRGEAGALDSELALVIGALRISAGPLSDLASMRRSEVFETPSYVERIAARLSDPRRVAAIVAIAAMIFLVAPLASAGVRWAILRSKLPDADQYQRQNRVVQQKVALYRQLADAAWPVTKLMGDLANAMPEGVEVESVQIATGDGITLRGLAKGLDRRSADGSSEKVSASDLLLQFERGLRQTGVFSNVDYKWDPEDARGWRGFTLTCQVPKPTLVVAWKEDDDFAVRDLRTRRYPNWREIEGGGRPSGSAGAAQSGAATDPEPVRVAGATTPPPTPPAVPASDPEANPVDATARAAAGDASPTLPSDRGIGRRRNPSGEEIPPADGAAPSASQPTRVPAVDIPGPFADEEIRALSRSEAQALLGKISRARQLPGLDPEVSERLKADFQRVLNQAKSSS